MEGLGNALCERVEGDRAENVEEAIRCYRACLGVQNARRHAVPLGQAQNNLGTAWIDRVRGVAAENVEEAIRCYRAALDADRDGPPGSGP